MKRPRLTRDQLKALKQIQQHLDQDHGHKGYFSFGWAGLKLSELIRTAEEIEE